MPQGRPPIKAPSPPAQSESRTSSASSRTSGTKRTHESRLQGRVTASKAGAPAYSADAPAQDLAREQRHPTYSVGALQPLRRTTGDDLLKARALPPRYLLRPSEEELERYVANCFADEILDQRLQLRTVHVEELSSTLIDPPQTEHFAVPPEQSWNPCSRCEEDEDTNTFHMTVDQANYIPVKRWQTNPDLQDPEMIETLRALGEMRIYSFGHMILVTWAVHLYFPDQRIRAIVTFLYRLLQTHDWERRIPELLHEFQPQMIDEDTTAEWPTNKNLKCAADRWVSCCRRAFKYLFDHLTGPIEFHPRWLQSDNVPVEPRREVRDHLLGQAELIVSNLRHLIYRQYGLQHFLATLERKTYVWKRLEKVKKRETTRNGLCLNHHTLVFAEKPVYDTFRARLRTNVFMVSVPEGDREYLRRSILNYFPGPDTRRVVFWIGRNYIVNGNRDDYDELIQDLCNAYSTHCGYV